MSSWHKITTVGLGIAAMLVGVAIASPAQAQVNQWDRNKKDCEFVLKAPERYPLPSVKECVMLWEQYRNVSGLSPDERSLYARGPSWLFVYGTSSEDKSLAQSSLGRMNKSKPLTFQNNVWTDPNRKGVGGNSAFEKRDDGKISVERLPPVQPRDAGKRARKKANKFNTKGFKHYKKRSYPSAIGQFEKALSIDPFFVKAKYNLACNQSLAGDKDGAIKTLLELESWQSSEAQAAFQRARKDKDFAPMHNDGRFRSLLGLVRLQILNGAGEPGLFHVARIRKTFLDRNFAVHQYGYDRHTRGRPLVYYREGYERQAQEAKEIVANLSTAVKKIDWDSPFDVIVVWGDP